MISDREDAGNAITGNYNSKHFYKYLQLAKVINMRFSWGLNGFIFLFSVTLALASDGFKHFCFVPSQATHFKQPLLEKRGLASLKIDIKSAWDQIMSNLRISTWSEVGRQHSREKIWEGFKCTLNTKAVKPDSCSVIHGRVREWG